MGAVGIRYDCEFKVQFFQFFKGSPYTGIEFEVFQFFPLVDFTALAVGRGCKKVHFLHVVPDIFVIFKTMDPPQEIPEKSPLCSGFCFFSPAFASVFQVSKDFPTGYELCCYEVEKGIVHIKKDCSQKAGLVFAHTFPLIPLFFEYFYSCFRAGRAYKTHKVQMYRLISKQQI